MYGISNKMFRSLVFSDWLTIMFNSEDEIDYSALKDYLDGKITDVLNLSNQLTLYLDKMTIVVSGYKIHDGLYITSSESDSDYGIPCPLEPKDLKNLLYYLYHMHVTV
jgi:hypothetical protein